MAQKAKDEAQLQSAKADLERYLTLAPENLASKQTLDAQTATVAGLEAQIKGDQANIDNARTQLQYTTITSPIQGRTGIRRVDVGNNVRATDTNGIVVVTQLQPISLIFTLPEDALSVVGSALSAGTVTVEAMSRDGSKELDRGTVTLVDNQIDQTTGTIRLKAVFPNPQNKLWPGQYVDARVLVRTGQGRADHSFGCRPERSRRDVHLCRQVGLDGRDAAVEGGRGERLGHGRAGRHL